MSYLLDVNFLIAVIDEDHVYHDFAKRWFKDKAIKGWATCPITENGVLRILSNPSYGLPDLEPGAIALYLQRLKEMFIQHIFIADDYSILDGTIDLESLIHHKQLTDAYLIGLAYRHKLKFVTFDRKIKRVYLPDKNADVIERL